jgi:hypothetical protein
MGFAMTGPSVRLKLTALLTSYDFIAGLIARC